MLVSRESIRLYGGRLEEKGSYTVFEEAHKNTVEEIYTMKELRDNKQDSKFGLVFSPSFTPLERKSLIEGIVQRGFAHTQEYPLSSYICDYITGHPYVIILFAEEDNLYAECYKTDSKQFMDAIQIDGAGKDPRVDILAEAIWKKLVAEATYLSKESSWDAIREVAKSFLASGKSELEDTIYLDGESHDFFIRRRDADIDNLTEYGSTHILSSLSHFVNKNQLDKNEVILALTGRLTNNSYFHDLLNGFASDMKDINEEWEQAILSSVMNDLNGINFSTGDCAGIDGLPLRNVKVSPSDSSIFFNITFPKGVHAIEVKRDGEVIRTVTDTQFRDTDLLPAHCYQYGFILVFKDENGYEKRSEECKLEVATTSLQLPIPPTLHNKEDDNEAVLSWNYPAQGTIRIYHSNRPFPQHENDVIKDINSLDYTALSSLGSSFHVKKDFCGERFFLPVIIIDNMGIVGKQQVVTSMMPPKGVRIDSTEVNHVKVIWIWDDIPAIRIKWKTEDGNEKWKDIPSDGQKPEFEIPMPGKSRNLTAMVSALYTQRGGTLLESEEITLKVTLSAIKVNFVSAKSEARFFMHKDEYILTLQAEGEPPCDLYVLLEEGRIPLDLTNFKSYLTIHHEDLADGTEKRFPLHYHRQQKGQPLFFRIIAADRSIPLKIVPETQKIK